MITIRRAHKDEVQDLQNLNDQIFMDNAKYDPDLYLEWAQSSKGKEYFTNTLLDEKYLCLIAEEDGKRIGYIAAGPKEIDYRNSRYFEIENMGVNPEYRSKGIGKLLMDTCFEWAKEQGYEKAFVNCYIDNVKAVEFYKKNGFDAIDISLERRL